MIQNILYNNLIISALNKNKKIKIEGFHISDLLGTPLAPKYSYFDWKMRKKWSTFAAGIHCHQI